jgi:hypothetical protein
VVIETDESDVDEDESPAKRLMQARAEEYKRLMRAKRNALAAKAAKRQTIDDVEQEDSPKSFENDDKEIVIDTPEAPVLKR